METLPHTWLIDLNKETNEQLIDKFLEWFNSNATNPTLGTTYKYHGSWRGELDFWNGDGTSKKYFITLEEWNKMTLGLASNEQFEQGEQVLVKDNHHDSWVEKTFVCQYKGRFIGENKGYLTTWDECKKKPSELDIKIEGLKNLAEEKGVKLTVICE